jgi:hypothetical protein
VKLRFFRFLFDYSESVSTFDRQLIIMQTLSGGYYFFFFGFYFKSMTGNATIKL